jgi:dTDP-4-dehydrorhamnose reductase
MAILVTGAGGQVGSELVRRAGDLPVVGLPRSALDISDAAAVFTALARHSARLVINAAGYTRVDAAEHEPEAAFLANRGGPEVLAEACAAAGIPLFHLSTEHVFDGQGGQPWREDAPVSPLGLYGHSKAAGEAMIRARLPAHLILRVSWVFGLHGRNFVRSLLALACEKHTIPVVGDQVGGPTPAADLATALLALAGRHLAGERLPWGTYHYCGQPFLSRAEFAEAVFEAACARGMLLQRPHVQTIATADWPGAELRPANARLDCRAAEQVLQLRLPSWHDALGDMLDEIKALGRRAG